MRGQAVFEPNDAFKLRLIAAHSEMPGSKGNNEPDMFYGTAPAAINEAFGDPCPDNDPENRRVCRNYAGEATFEASEATLIATYRFANDHELTSLTSWDEYELTQGVDADQLNISLLDFNDRQAGDAFQQELRIASPATGALQWIAGAFYYDSSFERGGWDGHSSFVLGSEAPLVPLAPGLPLGQPGDSGDLLSRNDTEYVGALRPGHLEHDRTIRRDSGRALADREQGHDRHAFPQSFDANSHLARSVARHGRRRPVARDGCSHVVADPPVLLRR